jgi:branched-chain amino acid aminotransferase
MSGSRQVAIGSGVEQALAGFRLPEKLGFGVIMAPVMYVAECRDGVWGQGRLQPYGPIQLDPSAKVLHYAQEYFEGMKAYKVESPHATLFRPERHVARFATSARRLCMPEVPEEVFMEGVCTLTAWTEPYIPGHTCQSLYLRPFVIGTQPNLGLGVSATNSFIVVASPSEAYHAGSMRVLVERVDTRAAVGGTGAVKVGGNYAASLMSAARAKTKGYDQSLWLDPNTRTAVEELSGMNFFAVIEGRLHTPKLSGSILPGITRDSLIELARSLGHEVVEETLPIDDLLADIGNGRCSEAFASGTAAVVSPISVIGDADGTDYTLPEDPGPVALSLKEALLGIQEGRQEDPFGWVHRIPRVYYPASAEVA